MRRILSLDGGGIRGVFSAAILVEAERKLGPLHQRFDLIAGTSTGGILACGLAAGIPATALLDLYAKRGREIFSAQPLSLAWNVLESKYSAAPLERILGEVLGARPLTYAKTKLLVTSYAIELPPAARPEAVDSSRAPFFFKSWDGPNALMRDVARATSAAPTYFPPYRFTNMAGETGAYVDGGVFANNPAACALSEALGLWPMESLAVVAIGTGQLERPISYESASDWGLAGWARPILSLLMDGSCDAVTYQLDRILREKHIRLDTSLGGPGDSWAASDSMDDASPENIDKLLGLASRYMVSPEGAAKLKRVFEL